MPSTNGSKEPATSNPFRPEDYRGDTLIPGEKFWADRYDWLLNHGYKLRPRFTPGWVASWKGTEKTSDLCEDGQIDARAHVIMDATRVSDGAFVVLKRIRPSKHPNEESIMKLFSSPDLTSDVENHCIQILEIIECPDDPDDPNTRIVAMPLLRPVDWPLFDTFGEVIEFFAEIFHGLRFIHKHSIAHCDVHSHNILMDGRPIFPVPWHPIAIEMRRDFKGAAHYHTRTQRPVKYSYIDFGSAVQFPALGDTGDLRLTSPFLPGDKSVPELQEFQNAYSRENTMPPERLRMVDPFAVDVYCLGNLVRRHYDEVFFGFEFMDSLVSSMVQDDPSKRPSMDEAVKEFDHIQASLSSWKLRSRVVKRKELALVKPFRAAAHWGRRIRFIVTRTPPIPTPRY